MLSSFWFYEWSVYCQDLWHSRWWLYTLEHEGDLFLEEDLRPSLLYAIVGLSLIRVSERRCLLILATMALFPIVELSIMMWHLFWIGVHDISWSDAALFSSEISEEIGSSSISAREVNLFCGPFLGDSSSFSKMSMTFMGSSSAPKVVSTINDGSRLHA